MRQRRRWVPWWVLALAFVLVPVLEIYVLIQVGQVIGAWWTVLLLVADGALGAWLMKREGGRALRALREALDQHRMPAKELADGALILVGGTLLLTPGFVTDVLGIVFVLPVTRPLARRGLTRYLERRFLSGPGAPGFTARAGGHGRPGRQTGASDPSVVPGEVVD